MQITIKTSRKEVLDDSSVYVVKSGLNKLFFNDYLKENQVWLELPGFTFDQKKDISDQGELTDDAKARVQMARAQARFRLSKLGNRMPSQDSSDYSPQGLKGEGDGEHTSYADPQLFKAVVRFYMGINQGDVIIVPGRGYGGNILVGEVVSDDVSSVNYESWDDATFLTRKVEWLGDGSPRHKLSFELSSLLSNRRAFHILPESSRQEIYDYAYGDWSFANRSNISLHITPRDKSLNQVNPASIATLNQMILYYGYLYDCTVSRERPRDYQEMIAELMLKSVESGEYAWEGSVHSPGEIKFRAQNAAKGAFIAAFFALSVQVSAAENIEPEQLRSLSILTQNKWKNIPSDCDVDVEERMLETLRYLNLDVYIDRCKMEQRLVSHSLDVNGATSVSLAD